MSSIAPVTYDDTALCQSGDLRQDPDAAAKPLGDKVEPMAISITPNPAHHRVDIVIDQSMTNGSITLVNAVGHPVLNQSMVDTRVMSLDISMMASGWYHVLIDNEGQILAREKLLIVHD